jgi:hypothetical protein
MYFNTNDTSFTATWFIESSVKSNTEVYVNSEIHYPHGYNYSIQIDGEDAEGVEFLNTGHVNYF